MIKIEKTETYGWEAATRGVRNPMNSWDKSDSEFEYEYYDSSRDIIETLPCLCIGKNDLALMKKLRNAGTDHRKFMRMITVYADVTAPLYWWKEYDTYKVGTVANSCSTMHKIHAKEFTYEVLANMYKSRKNHKLDEWHDFCDWIKTLPYSELITGEEENND